MNSRNRIGGKCTSNSNSRVAFEDVLKHAGDSGRWQWFVFAVASMSGFFNAFHHMGSVFLGAKPDHWCSLPEIDNPFNWTAERVKSSAIPRENRDNKLEYSYCFIYDRNYTTLFQQNWTETLSVPGNSTVSSPAFPVRTCVSWVFDNSQYASTIVSEWDLVCDRTALMSTVQASYMAGVFLGCLFSGIISDRCGRRAAFLLSMSVFLVAGLVTVFSVHYIMFLCIRFFVAMSAAGLFTSTFVLTTEIAGPSLRTMLGIFFQVPFAIGYMTLPLVAYLIRDWKYLQLAIALPSMFLILYIWLLPESPRWLMTKGRFDEALGVLKKAAKMNKKQLPPDDEMLLMMKIFRESEEMSRYHDEIKKHGIFSDLIRKPQIRNRTLTVYFTWFVVATVYYGLALNVRNMGSNIYFVSFLNAAVELPAYFFVYLLIMKGGRRYGYCGTFLAGGAACLSILGVPASTDYGWLMTMLAVVGKFCITATFAISYLFTAELFPTLVRNVAVNSSSMCGRCGSIIAPFIVDLLGVYNRNIPMIIFGVLSVLAGLLALLLPETNNRNMTESLDDGEKCTKPLTETSVDNIMIKVGQTNTTITDHPDL